MPACIFKAISRPHDITFKSGELRLRLPKEIAAFQMRHDHIKDQKFEILILMENPVRNTVRSGNDIIAFVFGYSPYNFDNAGIIVGSASTTLFPEKATVAGDVVKNR